jgi:hypothetical protein
VRDARIKAHFSDKRKRNFEKQKPAAPIELKSLAKISFGECDFGAENAGRAPSAPEITELLMRPSGKVASWPAPLPGPLLTMMLPGKDRDGKTG